MILTFVIVPLRDDRDQLVTLRSIAGRSVIAVEELIIITSEQSDRIVNTVNLLELEAESPIQSVNSALGILNHFPRPQLQG